MQRLPTKSTSTHKLFPHTPCFRYKIPYRVTPNGSIAETVGILEYMEETSGCIPLYPADAFGRARARQVINIAQVYIEAPLRSLFPGVFMGGVNDPATIAAVRPLVERAMRADRKSGV